MKQPVRRTNARRKAQGRAVHDLGGLPGGGAIDRSEHDLTLYEKRVDALLMLLGGGKRGAFKIDALRRVIEDYAEQEYDHLPYYDKWIKAIRNLVIEQELISEEELESKIGQVIAALEKEGRTVSRRRVE